MGSYSRTLISLGLSVWLWSVKSKNQTLSSLLQRKPIRCLPWDSWSQLQERNWSQASSRWGCWGERSLAAKREEKGQP